MENSPPLFIETASKNNNIITFLMFLLKEEVNAFVLARRCEYWLFCVSKIQVTVHLNAKQRGWG